MSFHLFLRAAHFTSANCTTVPDFKAILKRANVALVFHTLMCHPVVKAQHLGCSCGFQGATDINWQSVYIRHNPTFYFSVWNGSRELHRCVKALRYRSRYDIMLQGVRKTNSGTFVTIKSLLSFFIKINCDDSFAGLTWLYGRSVNSGTYLGCSLNSKTPTYYFMAYLCMLLKTDFCSPCLYAFKRRLIVSFHQTYEIRLST